MATWIRKPVDDMISTKWGSKDDSHRESPPGGLDSFFYDQSTASLIVSTPSIKGRV